MLVYVLMMSGGFVRVKGSWWEFHLFGGPRQGQIKGAKNKRKCIKTEGGGGGNTHMSPFDPNSSIDFEPTIVQVFLYILCNWKMDHCIQMAIGMTLYTMIMIIKITFS